MVKTRKAIFRSKKYFNSIQLGKLRWGLQKLFRQMGKIPNAIFAIFYYHLSFYLCRREHLSLGGAGFEEIFCRKSWLVRFQKISNFHSNFPAIKFSHLPRWQITLSIFPNKMLNIKTTKNVIFISLVNYSCVSFCNKRKIQKIPFCMKNTQILPRKHARNSFLFNDFQKHFTTIFLFFEIKWK